MECEFAADELELADTDAAATSMADSLSVVVIVPCDFVGPLSA
ncbi:hypothetical protein [Nocardia noduli]|nr:hypothetical protein [Nocardia noduli]